MSTQIVTDHIIHRVPFDHFRSLQQIKKDLKYKREGKKGRQGINIFSFTYVGQILNKENTSGLEAGEGGNSIYVASLS
jgi:hypothetical protein